MSRLTTSIKASFTTAGRLSLLAKDKVTKIYQEEKVYHTHEADDRIATQMENINKAKKITEEIQPLPDLGNLFEQIRQARAEDEAFMAEFQERLKR